MGGIPFYQWEALSRIDKGKDIAGWTPNYGPRVVSRKADGTVLEVNIRLLIDNPSAVLYLVGPFNDWGNNDLRLYEFEHDAHSVYASLTTNKLRHKTPYKILCVLDNNKRFFQDPAAPYYDDAGNSLFWDHEHPTSYKQKNDFVDTRNRPCIICQTDLPGLISYYKGKDGRLGKDVPLREYYNFIAVSGVLEYIKELGFNTIQFLPFAQSIDGTNWKYRYLVPFQYAINKNWGTPDDFSRMIDEAHKLGIAVIGDFVISHLPYKDYKVFGYDSDDNGLHVWIDRKGYPVFMREYTPWGTMRFHYDNPHVREFVIESCLSFMKYYKIDGFRIDNVDGILRYGDNGDGEERPYGRTFLRELTSRIYDYNPRALIHFEAHYFYGDNAKMLVVPYETDSRALGATAYNSSRETYFFHKDYMLRSAEQISPWRLRDIASEKEWGQSNSCIADFHNHDAAAGLMEQRATGAFAYECMTLNPSNHPHAIGKLKVMEAYISFCMEGRTLDLVQTFLLQPGTFEHDSSIRWYLTYNPVNKRMLEYKKTINLLMRESAFWPEYCHTRKFLNVDDNNKVIVLEKTGKINEKYVIVINTSSWLHRDYRVGVTDNNDYEVVLNSDSFDYAGFGLIAYPDIISNNPSSSFELLDRELVLSVLAPYGVVVLKRII
ncbi:MAG: alpha-amylase family glycosyl hydrolase [Candidatus Woesearchaeota archaeon]